MTFAFASTFTSAETFALAFAFAGAFAFTETFAFACLVVTAGLGHELKAVRSGGKSLGRGHESGLVVVVGCLGLRVVVLVVLFEYVLDAFFVPFGLWLVLGVVVVVSIGLVLVVFVTVPVVVVILATVP